jgi:mRNA interferase MazF
MKIFGESQWVRKFGNMTTMNKKYIPERGDIVWCSFSPISGHEQDGRRPALVITRAVINEKIKLALLAPITSKAKGYGTEVKINTEKTKGVILVHHVRMIDFNARQVEFSEKVDVQIVATVCGIVSTLIT